MKNARACLRTVASAILADVGPGFQPGGNASAMSRCLGKIGRDWASVVFSGRQVAALYGRPGGPPLLCKQAIKLLLATLLAACVTLPAYAAKPVLVKLQKPADAGQQQALRIFRRVVKEHTGLEVVAANNAPLMFGFRTDIGAGGFSIEDGKGKTIQVSGNGLSGLMAGVGKFLRTARLESSVFEPGAWRCVSVPQTPVRGVYFATHFFNWYHVAPVAEVRRYVEELSLWGCNSICVWFDMHQYQGMDDPEAQTMVARLREILRGAQDVGIKPSLMMLANEAFASSPAELRAEWMPQNGYQRELVGHYHVEVCPNQPGGMEYILKSRREVLQAFKEVKFKYLIVWPYDQGGCTCAKCAPWGANGFLKVASGVSALSHDMFPQSQIILSTWLFDHFLAKGDTEWSAFDKAIGKPAPPWIDYLMVNNAGDSAPYTSRHGVPGNLPLLTFPEISMLNNHPWGGYGANPSPERMRDMWAQNEGKLSGGYPYSEGLFEDINKAIVLQLYWNGQAPTQTVREYMAYEFSPQAAADLANVAAEMERSFSHSCVVQTSGELAAVLGALKLDQQHFKELLYPAATNESAFVLYQARNLGDAEGRLQRVQQAEKQLAPPLAQSWRWRIFYLRAAIDAELKRTGGKPSATLDAYFQELENIYHAGHTIDYLRPPGRPALLDLHP